MEFGKMSIIAFPEAFVVKVKDVFLEYKPVLIPVSLGNRQLSYSGKSTDAMA